MNLNTFASALNYAYAKAQDAGELSSHPHRVSPAQQVYVVTENPDGSQHLMAVKDVSFRNGDLYIKAVGIE